jgi:3-hydroxy-9,10-secoandrosta-1,3,5(10)-triene-9,17-dione monooxygenase reductase component
VTIHASNPFATPDEQRSSVRRLRGRLPSPVTLWTAGSGRERTGLTVSSALVVDGDPGRVLGIIGDEADLWAAVRSTRRFALIQLETEDRQVADRFAGLLPAPGGPFRVGEWEQTDYGPVPVARTWAGWRFDDARPYGWGIVVEASIEAITFAPAADALSHAAGRYRDIPLD